MPDPGGGGPPRTDFDSDHLVSAVIARPLAERLAEVGEDVPLAVVLELDREYPDGREGAKERVHQILDGIRPDEADYVIHWRKSDFSPQSLFLYGRLTGSEIRALIARSSDGGQAPVRRVWLDFAIRPLTDRSYSTVKADAALRSFMASGEGIVWAVMDSGVDAGHRHFAKYENLDVEAPLRHLDFTGESGSISDPLEDEFGHGTHVAGTIAGERRATSRYPIQAWIRQRDENEEITYQRPEIARISGMAPQAKIVSLKVLDKNGDGLASNLMAAIGYIQQVNSYGRELKIHGVNMSVGYRFDAEWYATGHSPLCVEVDRLVRTGVAVVVAAGNTGYTKVTGGGLPLSINDPGNAELAITVGATHRDEPYRYGVSYFSSKGPTGDGRLKPDLVAPGEKVTAPIPGGDSGRKDGTSMAAPHVSGAAALLMARNDELKGEPLRIKQILCQTATDLGRERYFQGAGMLDALRAMQAV